MAEAQGRAGVWLGLCLALGPLVMTQWLLQGWAREGCVHPGALCWAMRVHLGQALGGDSQSSCIMAERGSESAHHCPAHLAGLPHPRRAAH